MLKTPGVAVKRMGTVSVVRFWLRMECAARRQSVGLGGWMPDVKHFIACWRFSLGLLLEGGGGGGGRGHDDGVIGGGGGGAGALRDGLIDNDNESSMEKKRRCREGISVPMGHSGEKSGREGRREGRNERGGWIHGIGLLMRGDIHVACSPSVFHSSN